MTIQDAKEEEDDCPNLKRQGLLEDANLIKVRKTK